MVEKPETVDAGEPERSPGSSESPLAEGFRTLDQAREWWFLFCIRAVPIIAVIYGALALQPYYLMLGIAALVLIRFSNLPRPRMQL
jgi:hypothetical protein